MFDWIGDAIDWIGDGISSLWDNTIGSAVDTITDAIWDVMFEWLFNLIYGAVADLFEFINASTSSIFALSWVQSFIALFHSLAWMLFVCGLIVAVFDTAIAYESGQANIKNTCLNVLKGFMVQVWLLLFRKDFTRFALICRVHFQAICLEISYREQQRQ